MTLSQIHTCRGKVSLNSLSGQERARGEMRENPYLRPFGRARGH